MAPYDYTPDINPLDDEEERRRREREMAAMAAENDPMGRGAFTPSFGDVASQAFNQRLNVAKERLAQAGQMFTDPTTAFQQRMLGEQQQAAQDEAANTEVKTQTVKTYQDGSQERVVKTQVPAGQQQAQDAGARLTTPIVLYRLKMLNAKFKWHRCHSQDPVLKLLVPHKCHRRHNPNPNPNSFKDPWVLCHQQITAWLQVKHPQVFACHRVNPLPQLQPLQEQV